MLPGRRISVNAHSMHAQQDQEMLLNDGGEVHAPEDIPEKVHIAYGNEAGPCEDHTQSVSGEQWDPGVGWAGFDDPDAEW